MKSPEPNSQLLDPHAAAYRKFLSKPPLPPEFYLNETVKVAKDLLGKGLVVGAGNTAVLLQVVETEAYLGKLDPASHAFRGMTPRNRAMFERGGTCYVYLSYGLNYCMNVATQEKGVGEAILFRAGAPLVGLPMIKARRSKITNPFQLTNGPGKLCQALGIDLSFNGLTFDRPDFKLIDLETPIPNRLIGKTARIGITQAADRLLRFVIKDSPWLSRSL